MKVVQKQMCLYGRITLLSAWTFLEDCRRTICAALLRPHICGNYKFSFTLHPLHCDCCLHCDVEAQIIWKSLNKELLTLCCFYTVVSPLSSSWPCLCHLIYFSCNLPLILLTFSSQLLPPHPPHSHPFSLFHLVILFCFLCHLVVLSPCFFFLYFNFKSNCSLLYSSVTGCCQLCCGHQRLSPGQRERVWRSCWAHRWERTSCGFSDDGPRRTC